MPNNTLIRVEKIQDENKKEENYNFRHTLGGGAGAS